MWQLLRVLLRAGRLFQWIRFYRIRMIVVLGLGFVMALYLLAALNWAPVWIRIYSACMRQRPQAHTLTQTIRHREDCARLATRMIQKAP